MQGVGARGSFGEQPLQAASQKRLALWLDTAARVCALAAVHPPPSDSRRLLRVYDVKRFIRERNARCVAVEDAKTWPIRQLLQIDRTFAL